VYIVECADGSLYTGVSVDIASRICKHNTGKGAKYTRSRVPVTLVYTEAAGSKSDALVRELQIKKMSAEQKRILIAKSNEGPGNDEKL
jgi:putative endonuclease